MRDRYGIPKMIAFVSLAAVYFAGIAVTWAVSGDSDITAFALILGGFVVGGLALGIGVVE